MVKRARGQAPDGALVLRFVDGERESLRDFRVISRPVIGPPVIDRRAPGLP